MNAQAQHESHHRIHWLLRGGTVLLIIGGVVLAVSFALSPVWYILGALFFGAGVLWWAVILINRAVRATFGLPSRHQTAMPPTEYLCPQCSYDLRGTVGIYCPECGTVRPAPVADEHSQI